jgi:hypothetical protein
LGENQLTIENTDYGGGIGIVNIYGEIQLKSHQIIQITSDRTWLGTRNLNDKWKKVKSFDAPPMLIGGLCYPDFKNNKHSLASDMMTIFNALVGRFPKSLYWLLKFIMKLFNRYSIIE